MGRCVNVCVAMWGGVLMSVLLCGQRCVDVCVAMWAGVLMSVLLCGEVC